MSPSREKGIDNDPGASRLPRLFAHPPIFRRLGLWSIWICIAGCLFVLALPVLDPGEDHRLSIILSLGVFGSCLYSSISMVRRSRDTVEVAADGLHYHCAHAPSLFIGWGEVADVEAQNVMQRLLVSDSTGARKIYLEYHLQEFGDLRRIVLDRTGKDRRAPR
ncbi:MAG: hypothetical protein ABR587_01815 [Candidatus Binatia bacterium]